MATRVRRDIQTAVAFLTTRVKSPDEDDWGKLKQVLKYLNGTKYLKLRLCVDNLGLLKWFVDALHNTHWDCRGHRRAMLTMGQGATTSYSRKVKLNSRSSSKTELLTLDMYMPEMLWSLYFIQSQGYEPECVSLYQDNISTQLLIKNGNFSSGKKTKHIKAKFFFIKDKVDSGEIRVIDCPAEEMQADVLTKPLQEMAFRTMRAQLMNCSINYKDEEEKTQSKLMPVHSRGLVTWKDTKPQSLQAPQKCVGLNRQKHLLKDDRMRRSDSTYVDPILHARLGIARIQNRTKGAKNKVNSEQ
jgi:hypothetical protein